MQLRPGAHASADGLIESCRARVADYERPRSVAFVPEVLPNPSGEILKREIRAPYREVRPHRV